MMLWKKNAVLGGIVVIFFTFLETVGENSQKTPEVICESQPIKAAPGDDVVFLCSVNSNVTKWTLEWSRPDLQEDSVKKYVLVYRSQAVDINQTMESYKGRVSLFLDQLQNGNVSIKLLNVTVNDSGEYKCYLSSLRKSVVIQLLVSDEKNSTSKSENRSDKDERHRRLDFAAVVFVVVVFAAVAAAAPYAAAALAVVLVGIGCYYLFKEYKKKRFNKQTGQISAGDETNIPLKTIP